MTTDNRRYHVLIERQIDVFIEGCKKYIDEKKIKAWVIKDENSSMIAIGDPDKLPHNKDFGFILPYETIVGRHTEAFEEFLFKIEHFIKIANTMDKFKVFKNAKLTKPKTD